MKYGIAADQPHAMLDAKLVYLEPTKDSDIHPQRNEMANEL